MVRLTRLVVSFGLALALLCVAAVATAWAAPPPNDSRENATVIAGLPFTDTVNTTEATIGPEDAAAGEACLFDLPATSSVWYQYTPSTDQFLVIDASSSDYVVAGAVLSDDMCVLGFLGSGGFSAQPGQTYWIVLIDFEAGGGGSLELSVDVNTPPVCEDAAIGVPAGKSVAVPLTCTDADGDEPMVEVTEGPKHGLLQPSYPGSSTWVYTPVGVFSGQDSISFKAIDWWGAESEPGVIRITVTPEPKPPPQPSPPSADVTAPNLDLLTPPSLSLRTALRRGLRFTVTINEPGRLVVRAFVSRKIARRLKINKHAQGPAVVARLARDIAAGETVVKVKLSRKARSRLKRAKSVKLRIIAQITDAAGNVHTETLRLTLKRVPSS